MSDAPLTVKYTIAKDATWSDGVPVTPDDLVLEWAARSGQLDDVTPEVDAAGEVTNEDALAAGVAFAAASPALIHAEQAPVVDGATVTVTYATPVPDWQVALDVGVPAHVVGQTALGVEDPAAAATAVTAAITGEDKKALRSISSTWRTQFDADALAQHIDLAVSDGPYAIDRIVPGKRVELVRNTKYSGDRPAAYDRIVLRSDVEPLDEVSALSTGSIDVIAPVDTADVLDALAKVDGATVRTGGDSTLQLQLQVAGGGPFDPDTYGGNAATAAAVRTAFLLTVPHDAIVDDLVKPLWADAEGIRRGPAPGRPGRRRAGRPGRCSGHRQGEVPAGVREGDRPGDRAGPDQHDRPAAPGDGRQDHGLGRQGGLRGAALHPRAGVGSGPAWCTRGVGRRTRAGPAGRPAGRVGRGALADGRDREPHGVVRRADRRGHDAL